MTLLYDEVVTARASWSGIVRAGQFLDIVDLLDRLISAEIECC